MNLEYRLTLKDYISIARAWKSSSASFREPISVEITEEGSNWKGLNFESKVQWQLYRKFIETENLLILYQAKNLFNIIPKRAFDCDESIEKFKEILASKIENRG